jgi:threonine dehydrogenase-like Zn-dependent dehydrogenase
MPAAVGDGAVGLCGAIAARRLGAEQIIMLGRHADRAIDGDLEGLVIVIESHLYTFSPRCRNRMH